MLRIISGAYKGRRIYSCQGLSTRPTADRTRESIFNILHSIFHSFADKRVLDLYAGTGALGIEALSRGAVTATFVEVKKTALAALNKNISIISDVAAYEIIAAPVSVAFSVLQKRKEQFDLIFMDPPYGKNLVHSTLEALAAVDLCAPEVIVVCEYFFRDAVNQQYGFLSRFDTRRYGQTLVAFFTIAK